MLENIASVLFKDILKTKPKGHISTYTADAQDRLAKVEKNLSGLSSEQKETVLISIEKSINEENKDAQNVFFQTLMLEFYRNYDINKKQGLEDLTEIVLNNQINPKIYSGAHETLLEYDHITAFDWLSFLIDVYEVADKVTEKKDEVRETIVELFKDACEETYKQHKKGDDTGISFDKILANTQVPAEDIGILSDEFYASLIRCIDDMRSEDYDAGIDDLRNRKLDESNAEVYLIDLKLAIYYELEIINETREKEIKDLVDWSFERGKIAFKSTSSSGLDPNLGYFSICFKAAAKLLDIYTNTDLKKAVKEKMYSIAGELLVLSNNNPQAADTEQRRIKILYDSIESQLSDNEYYSVALEVGLGLLKQGIKQGC